MISNLFRQLIASFGIAWRTIRAFFMRWIVGIGARAKRFTSASRLAAKGVPKAMGAVAVAGQKPTKREDYIETERLYIAKSLIVILAVGVIVIALLFYFLLWPRLQSAFFTAHLFVEDARVETYSGRVVIYYDKDKDAPAFKGRLEDGLAQGAGEEYDRDGFLRFTGNFVDGLYEGSGKEYNAGVLAYVGDFSNGMKQGQGAAYGENGALLYKGAFYNDAYDGQGTLYTADETPLYVGAFSGGKYHGAGTLYLLEGQTLNGSFENGEVMGTASIFYKGKLSYEGSVAGYSPDGFGSFYSLDSGKLLYEGPVKNGMPDLQALLSRSLEEAYELFGEATVYEERNGEENFSVVNEALGLTLLFPTRSVAAEPTVLSALLYEGREQTYLTINPALSGDDEAALSAWIAAMEDGKALIDRENSASMVPMGTTTLRGQSDQCTSLAFSEHSYMVFSVQSRVQMIVCTLLRGGSGGDAGGGTQEGSEKMTDRADALLNSLEQLKNQSTAASRNAYYGSRDPASLFENQTLSVEEKTKLLQSVFDYFEAAEKRAIYENKRDILTAQFERAQEAFNLGGDEADNISEIEARCSAADTQISQCIVAMEKAQIVANSLTGAQLKNFDLQRVIYVLDPAKISLDALSLAVEAEGAYNSVDMKLEVLNLELCYQQVLSARSDYEKRQAELATAQGKYDLGQVTQAQLEGAELALTDRCALLYEAICDYQAQLAVLNGMSGGYVSNVYGWLPAAFTKPPVVEKPLAEEAPAEEPPAAEQEGQMEKESPAQTEEVA